MQEYSTILVTGATGLIGSNLVRSLLTRKKVRVLALSRDESKLVNVFREHLNSNEFDYIVADTDASFQFNKALDNKWNSHIDVVFHAASPIDKQTMNETPLNIINPNLFATRNI